MNIMNTEKKTHCGLSSPIVDEFQLGNAVIHESEIGPQVFQTAHYDNVNLKFLKTSNFQMLLFQTCINDKRENSPSINHLLL